MKKKGYVYLFILFYVLGTSHNVHFGYMTGGAGRDYGLRHDLLVHTRYLHEMYKNKKFFNNKATRGNRVTDTLRSNDHDRMDKFCIYVSR
ncbi:hypothetical protein HI914_05811 [Erysiphe necator]|nr:hypothetical protein HI914_05811 [Erysiphe necator]